MTKADTWMPLYVNDYLGKTMRLTTEQHGAYLLLIMEGWKSGGRLPDDDDQLAAITKMAPKEWKRIAPIIRRYFTAEGGDLVQSRLTHEFEKARRLSDARRETGSKGGRPKKQNESKPKPIGYFEPPNSGVFENQNETPACVAPPLTFLDPNGPKKIPPTPLGGPSEAFRSAWKAYPTNGTATCPPGKAAEAWQEAVPIAGSEERLLAAFTQFAKSTFDGTPRRFDRWLHDRSFVAFLPEEGRSSAWCGPADIRAAIVAECGEPWTAAWLDPAAWRDLPERTIVAHSSLAARKLIDGVGHVLANSDVIVEVAA